MLTTSLVAASTGLLVALPLSPALADDSRIETSATGQCSGNARWEMKAKERDGGVEVEFEVDSNVAGQSWDFTLSGPGGVLASGTRTTTGPSGSFSVEVSTTGSANDVFTGLATYNGQTCDTTGAQSVREDSPGSDDKRETSRGTCSDDSRILLSVKRTGKSRMATLRVDSDRKGEKWTYEIRRGGRLVEDGSARTKGRKADFKVKAKATGKGSFTASAQRVGSDDTCSVDD